MGIIAESKAKMNTGKTDYVKVRDILNAPLTIERVNVAKVDAGEWDEATKTYIKNGDKVDMFFIDYTDSKGAKKTVRGSYNQILSTIAVVGADDLTGAKVKFIELPNYNDKTKTHFEMVDA